MSRPSPTGWRDRFEHRAQWAYAFRDLAVALARPARSDPTMVTLRRALAGQQPNDLSPSSLDALAAAATRHEVEVIAAELIPALASRLANATLERRRADAILELATQSLAPLSALAPVALLKGSASAVQVYPHTAWRHRKDLDLLVGDNLPMVRKALLAQGWTDAVTPLRQAEGPDAVRAWPMVRSLGPYGVSLDLHRKIHATAWCHVDSAAVLAAAAAAAATQAGRTPLPITTPADTLLTTVVHLVGSGFHEPLKGWLDVARLVPLVSPAALIARSNQFGLTTATWLCLTVVRRWFGVDTTSHEAGLAPASFRIRLLTHLAAGDHDTPERRPFYKGLSQRIWQSLLNDDPVAFHQKS